MFIVEEWMGGVLRGYDILANPGEAFVEACRAFGRVLNGRGRIRVVDHERIEIPHSSSGAFLELGKNVGIVQDGSENEVWIRPRAV